MISNFGPVVDEMVRKLWEENMRPYEEKYVRECYQAMQEEHDACGIGLVVNIDGKKEYRTLDDALSIVEKLEHRAGKDATGEVGDGVGILVQISHKFFKNAAKEAGIEVKDEGDYGVGMFFLPQDTKKRTLAMRMFKVITEKNGLKVMGWREVPTNPDILGKVEMLCRSSCSASLKDLLIVRRVLHLTVCSMSQEENSSRAQTIHILLLYLQELSYIRECSW